MERYMTEAKIVQYRSILTEDEKSITTIGKYVRDLETFLRFTGETAVTKELVIRYKQYLIEHYAPASVNSMLAAVNVFFKEMGWYDCVVKSLKVQRQVFRPEERELTKEEYYRLLGAAKAKNNIRLYLLMQAICATGIRVGELRFITLEAVRCGRATVSLKGKTRIVLLPSALRKELREYAKSRGIQSGSIFITKNGKTLDRSNILHDMKSLCEDACVDRRKVFPHNLRHLFACLFYREERDLGHLADILGHSNINTTRIYTSISGDEHARQIERLGLVVGEKQKTA